MRTDIWERVSLHPHWQLHLQPPESSRAIFLAIHKNGAYTQWAHIGGLHSPKPDTSPFKHQNGAISLTLEWSPHPMSRHWWLGYTHLHQSLLPSYREWSHLSAYNSLQLLHQMSWYWWLGYTHFQKSLLHSYREWSHLLAYTRMDPTQWLLQMSPRIGGHTHSPAPTEARAGQHSQFPSARLPGANPPIVSQSVKHNSEPDS